MSHICIYSCQWQLYLKQGGSVPYWKPAAAAPSPMLCLNNVNDRINFCEPTMLLNLYKQQITAEPHKQRLGCHLIPPAKNSLALPLKFLLIWLL